MVENEHDLLVFARKIKNYCKSRKCEINCVFFRRSENECGLEELIPCYWVIPRKNRGVNDGRE